MQNFIEKAVERLWVWGVCVIWEDYHGIWKGKKKENKVGC